MINQITDFVDSFRLQVYSLRQKALDYPEIYVHEMSSEIWLSSMVRFVYNGIEFNRHHVETSRKAPFYTPEQWEEVKNSTFKRFNESAKQTRYLAVPCKFDEIIGPKKQNNSY